MPVTKSAKKALRQSGKREALNKKIRSQYRAAVKSVRENPSAKGLQEAFSALDKAVKKNVIHKNKASRLKSQLARLLPQKPTKKSRTSKKGTSKRASKK